MIQRIFLAAIAAGVLAGVLISGVQAVTTTPIILQAEAYESAAPADHAAGGAALPAVFASPQTGLGPNAATPVHEGHAHDGEAAAWAPADGIERALFTTLANLLVGTGFALLVVAGFALHGRPVTVATGLHWGAAGFAVFTLAPALGLPPEVPGTLAGDLTARQLWWASAVGCAAIGLGLLAFLRHPAARVAGVVVAALPHVVGAPHPTAIGGAVPPELAGQFAASSIVVNAVFWALIGWLAAVFWRRLSA
ncbi:MAG: CbtA family protein [Azospirillaceae bacterium]